MNLLNFFVIFQICFSLCGAGVTEIPPVSEEDGLVESVSDDTWMPANIFDVKPNTKEIREINNRENAIVNDVTTSEPVWNTDSSPIFRAIRDFIFQTGEGLLEPEEQNEDPTEEIVKIIEKGLIEATTMFLTPSNDEPFVTSENPRSDAISIVKIENEVSDTLMDRIGLNIMESSNSLGRLTLSATNTTTACSSCYNGLETCVQQCFINHNCHDVQRRARICPPPTSRLCNIFTQWGPDDDCKDHEDCKSPLLCCNDGCINKCSPGVWRD